MKVQRILLLFVIAITAFACQQNKQSDDSPIVTVTIPPQKFFVEKIAGELVSVNIMVPPGISPEEYEPTPRQIQELSNSVIYFYVGHLGFEKPWMSRFNNSAPDVDYVSNSKGIDLLVSDHHCDENDHTHNHGTDPHIWTSPENVKTMSRTISSTLSKHFPESKALFESNLKVFIDEIDSLDNHIRALLADSTERSFMIFHPSLGYFARDYHLQQLSVEYEGKTPSTAHMKKIVDTAREKHINTIFVQSQFETAQATAIAHEIGATVEMLDPLEEDWISEMYSMADKIKKSLAQ